MISEKYSWRQKHPFQSDLKEQINKKKNVQKQNTSQQAKKRVF